MIGAVEADRAVYLADTAMAEAIVAGRPGLKYALRNLLLRSAERLHEPTEDRRLSPKGKHS